MKNTREREREVCMLFVSGVFFMKKRKESVERNRGGAQDNLKEDVAMRKVWKAAPWLVPLVCVCVSVPALGTYSVGFSTGVGHSSSWTIEALGGSATLSFANNEIDTSEPTPDSVLDDVIELPPMSLTNVQSVTLPGPIEVITAILVPDGSPLTIAADVASGPAVADEIVMSAAVGEGGLLTVGTNFIAYSNPQDDLNIINHVGTYSAVIDGFVAMENLGFDIDLSFGGNVSASLYNLLENMAVEDGSVSGVLDGQIMAIPEPLTLSLLGIGGLLLRRKRKTS